GDDDLLSDLPVDRDILNQGTAVLDDENERTFLARLNRALRQRHGILFDALYDAGRHELSRPQFLLVFFDTCLQQNGPRRGIDRVVDEYEIAFGYGRPAAARSDLHLE